MPSPFYSLSMLRLDGTTQPLSDYAGKVILVVNTASQCGFTGQYAGLEKLYQTYVDRGLIILGVPCNQFGAQEPGSESEIASFCQLHYDVQFPMFAKTQVNGARAHPLYVYLKAAAPGVWGTQAIKWNFTKFLVDRRGEVVARFSPMTQPNKLAESIEQLL